MANEYNHNAPVAAPVPGAAGRRVHVGTYAAYGLGDMLGSGALAVIGAWVLYFYTTFCGLTATQAASIFAIARLVDAFVSPLIGQFSDRLGDTAFGRRFGRRRVFLLGCLPLLPSFALMWVSGQSFWYYLATYVFFEVVYATVLIPYETLAAEMSEDYKVRARFAGARIVTGQVAAIAAGILPALIVNRLGKDSADTFLVLGGIFSAVIVVSIAIVWACTWERPPRPVDSGPASATPRPPLWSPVQMFRDVLSTLRVRAFRQHLGMYLGGYTAIDTYNAAFTYFVIFALAGNVGTASKLVGSMSAAQLVGVAIFIPLVIRFGPARCYRLAALLFAVAVLWVLGVYFVRPDSLLLWCGAAVLLAGLGRGGLIYIPWNVYNYIPDVDEMLTTERREGVFAGTMTFVRKAVQAMAVMVVGLVLDASGFVAGAKVQPDSALLTMAALVVGGPLVFLSFGAFVSWRFVLDADTHGRLMRLIHGLRRGESQTTDADTRRVVEAMTGHPFNTLWRGRAR
jgi:oligogalacturonide transporter